MRNILELMTFSDSPGLIRCMEGRPDSEKCHTPCLQGCMDQNHRIFSTLGD